MNESAHKESIKANIEKSNDCGKDATLPQTSCAVQGGHTSHLFGMKKAELNEILHLQHYLAENDDFQGELADYQGNLEIYNFGVHVPTTLDDH